MGLLLHGIGGTGKTSIIKHYCIKSIKEHNSLVFYINEFFYISECWKFIQKIRNTQDNPIVLVFEEFERSIDDCESDLKLIMDGILSIDNCIFLATTNYIDRIPPSLKDRKSRFKYSLELNKIEDKTIIENIVSNLLDKIKTKKKRNFNHSQKFRKYDFR